MLKKVFAGFLIFLTLLFFGAFIAYLVINSPVRIMHKVGCDEISVHEKEYSQWFWKEGRSFTFEVAYFGVIPVGSAEISMANFSIDKKDYLVLKADALLNEWIRKRFQAKATAASYVDKQSYLPFMYTENVETDKKRTNKEVMFDQAKHLATQNDAWYKIVPETFDPVSAIMMLFAEDFSKPEIVINIFSKQDPYELRAQVKPIKGDLYQLIGVMERKNKSNNAHRVTFALWVKNGAVRVPLLLKVSTPVGIICMRLRGVK